MADKQQKIGVMGGTFDPIHIGHLALAEAVREEYQLTKALFIPAANPPHKQEAQLTPALHRYIMTALAIHSNPYFFISPLELKRPGLSYAVDTIAALRAQYGEGTEFYFITGSDALLELPTWGRIDELLGACHFITAPRPGCNEDVEKVIRYFGEIGRARIHRLTTAELEISSTDIRDKVRRGVSIRYLVPEAVASYIEKEKLYR